MSSARTFQCGKLYSGTSYYLCRQEMAAMDRELHHGLGIGVVRRLANSWQALERFPETFCQVPTRAGMADMGNPNQKSTILILEQSSITFGTLGRDGRVPILP